LLSPVLSGSWRSVHDAWRWATSTAWCIETQAWLATFATRQEAEDDLAAVLRDERSWAEDLSIETFTLVAQVS
jgi:hypothetical protein